MKIIGKLSGSILGGLLTTNIIGILIGGITGHLLFDYNFNSKSEDIQIDEDCYSNNANVFTSIINLCYSLINLKGNISTTEIASIKYFFRNEFKFEKKDIKQIDEMISNLCQYPFSINIDKTILSINNYCEYQDKILITELLFYIAISDRRITEDETNFIFNITQKLNIQSNDYIKIKNLFTPDEDNFYSILKVNENATNEEIKSAYRRLVNIYHPDKHRDEEYNDKERFQKIVKAYQEIKKQRKF